MKNPMRLSIFTESRELFEDFRDKPPVISVGVHDFLCTGFRTKTLSLEADFTEVARMQVTLTGEGLPPIESTVRIMPGAATIWDVAEQFVGVDCRLKAVFMLEETQMVAVEGIESGQCCCFWASMVRTPEQAKAEERMNSAIALYKAVMNYPSSRLWHRLDSERQEHFLSLIDAGWQQVKP